MRKKSFAIINVLPLERTTEINDFKKFFYLAERQHFLTFLLVFPHRPHKFICNSNGLWQGTWPKCTPKQTCAKEEILEQLPDSIMIESIGNVYYSNETEWSAIDQSWVRYACASQDGIMVGNNFRRCMKGKWSHKVPHCERSNETNWFTMEIPRWVVDGLSMIWTN